MRARLQLSLFVAALAWAVGCGSANPEVTPADDAGTLDAGLAQLVRGCLVVSPQTLDFGDVVANTTATGVVGVTNRCGVDVAVTVSELSGTDALLFAIVPAGGSAIELKDGATTSFTVQYTPLVARSTLDQGYFALGLCAGGTGCWALVSLRGHAIETGLAVDPTTLDFGFGVGPSPGTRCAAFTNIGNALIHLTGDPVVLNTTSTGALVPSGPFQPAPGFPTKDTVIAPGETLLICVTFTPDLCPAKYTGELDISTDDANEANIKIPLAAFSGGPVILCSPSGLDFGLNACGGTASTLSILCTNIGQNVPGHPEANLVLWSLSFQNGDPAFSAAFDQPFPDGGVAAGASIKIDVTYAPMQPGAHSDTLIISTNDTCVPQPTVQVSGTCR
jgi:hypothetical protein